MMTSAVRCGGPAPMGAFTSRMIACIKPSILGLPVMPQTRVPHLCFRIQDSKSGCPGVETNQAERWSTDKTKLAKLASISLAVKFPALLPSSRIGWFETGSRKPSGPSLGSWSLLARLIPNLRSLLAKTALDVPDGGSSGTRKEMVILW